MNVHKGHRKRLKEKYIKSGFENFADHEVLELFLYYCYPRIDTNEIAHKILNEYGSLSALFSDDPVSIEKRLKVSSNIAILLSLPSKLSEKYLSDKFKQKYNVIDSNEKAAKYLVSFFLNKSNECFYLVMLDVAGKVIETVLVQEGTIDRVHFYPRNIIKLIFKYEAASVILAHNHPSGNLNPSGDDIIITREILNALKIINVTLFDHIIISGPNFYSFSNASLL